MPSKAKTKAKAKLKVALTVMLDTQDTILDTIESGLEMRKQLNLDALEKGLSENMQIGLDLPSYVTAVKGTFLHGLCGNAIYKYKILTDKPNIAQNFKYHTQTKS